MSTTIYRVTNAGYRAPKNADTLEQAVTIARTMCDVAESSSIIADPETGKTFGGCDIDPQSRLPISWLNNDMI